MSNPLESQVAAHYSRSGLLEAILQGLHDQGSDLNALTTADLAPVDEFHTAGRATTVKALDMAPIQPGMRMLDAGCGIGGTSRYLARDRQCTVVGIDLTPEYVEVARELSKRMGLEKSCTFYSGSILELPFNGAEFDGVVNFHVAMNIEDRSKLYSELARVMKTDGFLCLFDVMKGPAAGMKYPVPWAEREQTSFLRSRDETVELLEDAGLNVIAEENLRHFAIEFFEKAFAKMAETGGPPPLGLHLLTGIKTADKFSNYASALGEHQIEPVILVARKA